MAETTTYRTLDTSIGTLRLVTNSTHLLRIEFPGQHGCDGVAGKTPLLTEIASQLQQYLSGARKRFSLPLAPAGTTFQKEVWDALLAIPYGESRSYMEIARAIGRPRAVRAVGAANGRNPLPLVIPCHRVIGSNGKLTGYAGGLDTKTALLALESSPATA
ncbi:MAG: methylated-DNA--[protein]-cysteine S-methyltransferase [Pseudomonadota bacterium]